MTCSRSLQVLHLRAELGAADSRGCRAAADYAELRRRVEYERGCGVCSESDAGSRRRPTLIVCTWVPLGLERGKGRERERERERE
jgi:hypothetical protein